MHIFLNRPIQHEDIRIQEPFLPVFPCGQKRQYKYILGKIFIQFDFYQDAPIKREGTNKPLEMNIP